MVVIGHGDDALYRACRPCGARWHRHPPSNALRATAEAFVEEWPAFGFRPALTAWSPTPFRVFDDPGAYDVIPTGSGEDSAVTGRDAPAYIVTAWNPSGQPKTLKRNRDLHRQLRADVRHRRWDMCEVATYDPALRWAEQALLLMNVSEVGAARLARTYSQVALLRWDQTGVTTLSSDNRTAMTPPNPIAISRDTFGCPMRTIEAEPQQQVVCRNPGGPWVGASIHESARWRHQRQMLLATIGCNVCGSAPADGPPGEAIYASPMIVASRYGLPDEEAPLSRHAAGQPASPATAPSACLLDDAGNVRDLRRRK